jgi:hypothetical protein
MIRPARLTLAEVPLADLSLSFRAFGHEHSATAVLEQRLREAIASRNWALVGEIAKKLAQHDRQAG